MYTKRPFPLHLLLFLQLLLGLGGVFGGLALSLYPAGGGPLQVPVSMLAPTPFENFLIPGIILLIFNGLFPLLVFYGLLFRPGWHWPEVLNMYPKRYWAWTFSLYSGIILAIWIDLEWLLLGPPGSLLQVIYSLWATVIIVFTMWPGVMRYFERE